MKQIILTKGQVTFLDDEDYLEFSKYKWHASYDLAGKVYYAARKAKRQDGKPTTIKLAREIMIFNKYDVSNRMVDHINGNTLDNRKINLRVCTNSQNQCNKSKQRNNTSGYKGVHRLKIKTKNKMYEYWVAKIKLNNRDIYLGTFKDNVQAYKSYVEASKKYHGEYARL